MRSRIYILFISVLFLTLVSTSRAATFVVDRADDPQAIPLTCSAAPDDCSLRGALIQANGNGAGSDIINFNVPGSGVKTIILNNRLPDIKSSLTINGATQSGYAGKPVIELRGNGAEFGLAILSSNDISVSVIALAINSFSAHGVGLDCEARCNLTLLGNFIGTDPTGTIAKGNGHNGVYVEPSPNSVIKIGGTGAFEGNVISGNYEQGIIIVGNDTNTGSAQITILGNKIGTDYSGTVKIANHEDGIRAIELMVKVALTIGGAAANARNLISGNDELGIYSTCSDVTIKGNYIGTNVAGNAALGNNDSGIKLVAEDSSLIKIGGAAVGEGNLISGNGDSGVEIDNGLTDASGAQVLVRGNFIGMNVAGTADLGNSNDGIEVDTSQNNAANITIGGATPSERNVISGNDSSGIMLGGGNVFVYNNFIGTDKDGTGSLGNGYAGINVIYYVHAVIGDTIVENGTSYDAGNTISGNLGSGIVVPDFAAFPAVIRRNRIGTNPAGTFAVPNTGQGIEIYNVGSTIGSDTSMTDGNTISGNIGNGIFIGEGGKQTRIYANKIGTNGIGGDFLPNGRNGIDISDSPGNQIGLAGMGAATNIISGNGMNGIHLTGSLTTGNRIENNIIGAGVIGNDLGNTESGVLIETSASQNFVGSVSGTGNTIAFNARGVYVYFGANNEIRRNRIFSNDGLGIDLEETGVTPNDPGDADNGSNHKQNFPVLSVVNPNNIAGTLNSRPNTSYEIDFYRVDSCDASGYGEGRLVLASQTVTTNGAGNASFNQFAVLNLGQAVAATATVAGAGADDTSEFSNCRQVTEVSSVALSSLVYSANEGAGSRTIVVERSGDASGVITVDYATTDGTAVAGQDYAATSGTLTFNSGEIVKSFDIPIINDASDEPDETVHIALSNATGGFIGFPSTSVLTIVDNDNPPSISISDVSSAEGNSGNTGFTFHVSLSAASSFPVSVNFATADGTANLSDYTGVSGQINFTPGETSKPITVSVIGDAVSESNETFFVNLSNPTNATISDNQGTGTILDDDVVYSIGGTITKSIDSTPLAGVTVQLSGNQTAQTTTDANGRYFFQNLQPNGSYTITPSAANYTFNPVGRQYSNLAASVGSADFTAIGVTPRQVQVIGGIASPGQTATITTELAAQGDEHNVSFSLSYDSTILSNPQVALLPDSQMAILWVDNSIPGKVGVSLAMPVNQPYPAGIRQLVSITFDAALTNVASTPVDFADTPTVRQVYDVNSNLLPANYAGSAIAFAPGFEADVAPRPNGTGNGTVTVADFTQVGRFVAGLDTVNSNANEFQRADSAPHNTLGNGTLSVADFTQAGRYAAGLDAVQSAGGAMQANLFEFNDDGKLSAGSLTLLGKLNGSTKEETQNLVPTDVHVVNTQASPGNQVVVTIASDATGTENGFGFTLSYDAAKLSNPVVAKGADTQSATLITNTNAAGKIGVVLAMPFGQAVPAGARQLVTIQFTVAANAPGGSTALTFGDIPVVREVSDVNANVLQSNFQDGAINILGPTASNVTIGGRVRDAKGIGLPQVLVTLSNGNGQTRTARTNTFGYYRFTDVPAGGTYILTVSSKKYAFANPTRVVNVQDDVNDLDFVSEN